MGRHARTTPWRARRLAKLRDRLSHNPVTARAVYGLGRAVYGAAVVVLTAALCAGTSPARPRSTPWICEALA